MSFWLLFTSIVLAGFDERRGRSDISKLLVLTAIVDHSEVQVSRWEVERT